MSKKKNKSKKKSGDKKLTKYEKAILITAILNLIKSIIDLIKDLLK